MDIQEYVLPKPIANRSSSGDASEDGNKVYWLTCDFNVTQAFLTARRGTTS